MSGWKSLTYGIDKWKQTTIITPLQSARGFLGRFKLWRDPPALTQAERTHAENVRQPGSFSNGARSIHHKLLAGTPVEESDRF